MRTPSYLFRIFPIVLLLVLLVACGGVGSRQDLRDITLSAYAGAIRWGHIDDALGMVDPDYASEHPMSALARARFDQVEFTGYQVKGTQMLSETELVRMVEIRLVNRHTLVERTVQEREHWRWDEATGRWWLTTGLPDISSPQR